MCSSGRREGKREREGEDTHRSQRRINNPIQKRRKLKLQQRLRRKVSPIPRRMQRRPVYTFRQGLVNLFVGADALEGLPVHHHKYSLQHEREREQQRREVKEGERRTSQSALSLSTFPIPLSPNNGKNPTSIYGKYPCSANSPSFHMAEERRSYVPSQSIPFWKARREESCFRRVR